MCALTPNLAALATSSHTAFFQKFYAAAAVCSPTRAAILTGRTNDRDCIHDALPCDSEDPAPGCAMGKNGSLPWEEFTTAKAAKKTSLGNYSTLFLGKWHLGDLWDKKLPDMNPRWPVSSPSNHGFDDWLCTQAEASSSMSNCGCFPVNHTNPGPRPPSGYATIFPNGDGCVVGGGFESDWCYPCTDYYLPNSSDPRGVSSLQENHTRVVGDDSEFLVDRLGEFLESRWRDNRPFLVQLSLHSIHEPHPAMPKYYDLYEKDPDYLGTLTQLDVQIGRIRSLLEEYGMSNNTMIIFTSDNGPHQGHERSDIRWSTRFLRQCKASVFEGGLRVPGFVHWPARISSFRNITTPVSTVDILPTIMELLQVESDNPTWVMDGVSFLGAIDEGADPNAPREKPLVFSWGTQQAIIDKEWKLVSGPLKGQCDAQPGFNFDSQEKLFLFNLAEDENETQDRKFTDPDVFERMSQLLDDFRQSLRFSQVNETGCASE
eukprot:c11050_g1_i1.p1 GENE.c11050_g1_i1~~c11050_g1_i1.p1  ORF type:complete len:572 (+),score=118.97 c11050_g1_i1:255-1718(+)